MNILVISCTERFFRSNCSMFYWKKRSRRYALTTKPFSKLFQRQALLNLTSGQSLLCTNKKNVYCWAQCPSTGFTARSFGLSCQCQTTNFCITFVLHRHRRNWIDWLNWRNGFRKIQFHEQTGKSGIFATPTWLPLSLNSSHSQQLFLSICSTRVEVLQIFLSAMS